MGLPATILGLETRMATAMLMQQSPPAQQGSHSYSRSSLSCCHYSRSSLSCCHWYLLLLLLLPAQPIATASITSSGELLLLPPPLLFYLNQYQSLDLWHKITRSTASSRVIYSSLQPLAQYYLQSSQDSQPATGSSSCSCIVLMNETPLIAGHQCLGTCHLLASVSLPITYIGMPRRRNDFPLQLSALLINYTPHGTLLGGVQHQYY